MEAIETKDLSRKSVGANAKNLLQNLTLSIPEGARVGLLGGNGAGKTTFFKLLLGLAPIGKGEAFIFGRAVPSSDSRKDVGFLPEQASCFDSLTAQEYLALYGRLEGLKKQSLDKAVAEALEGVGLAEQGKIVTRHFSKGMLQKLEIARVLLQPRRLLLLDEPLSGLDVEGKLTLEDRFMQLAKDNITMVITSHEPRIFDRLCTHYALLQNGRLLRFGTRDELLPAKGWLITLLNDAPFPKVLPKGGQIGNMEHSIEFDQQDDALQALKDCIKDEHILSFGPLRSTTEDLFREVSQHV